MTSSMLRGVRGSLGLLAAGTILGAGTAAAAQTRTGVPPGAVVQPLPAPDSGAELRRHLANLAANPRDLSSLIGAGRAAIAVGDGQAALGFFGRAEEIAPRDARVKAGMGSAFVLLEQPQAALRFFAEATQLGAPEAELARDRGLAFDMTGNPRRAQQDYMLVLQRGEDAETRRRLALSLAISGNRDAAVRTLEPLLRRQDRAAYRTRAFILALTGDAAGAAQAAEAAMPGQGQAMSPFFARLAGLNPAQKAMAVHFGQFPADGRPVQMAQGVDTSALPAAVAMSGARPTSDPASRPAATAANRTPTGAGTGVRRRVVPAPVNREPRRRVEEEVLLDRFGRPVRDTRAAARPTPARQRTMASTDVQIPSVLAEPRTSRPTEATLPAAAPAQPLRIAAVPQSDIPPAMRQDGPPPVADRPPVPTPAPREAPPPAPAPTPAVPAFSDVAALVESLPTEEPVALPAPATRPARQPATTPTRTSTTPARTTTARAATPAPTRARTPAAPAHPSRHWVQLAGGARDAMNYELGRVRRAAPALMQGRTAFVAANGSSSRLLVGPFATSAEARAFVNQLARQQVSSFPWTSAAGEEVARLPAR